MSRAMLSLSARPELTVTLVTICEPLAATNLLVFHIHISSESVFTQCNWFRLLLWAFGKKPDTGCWACWSSVTVKNIFVSITHVGILFSQVGLHIRRGEWFFLRMDYRSKSQSGNRSSILAFMKSLIDDDDLVNFSIGIGPSIEPGDAFLDLKSFVY